MIWLRLVHIVAGILWAGSAFFSAVVLLPTARAAGAEGRRFLGQLAPRMAPVLGIAMLLTIAPGFILFGRLASELGHSWVTSASGLTLATGAVAAIVAILVGLAVNAPAATRIAKLRKATEGRSDGADTDRFAALEARIERGTQLVALLLLIAAGAMAVARYL